MKSTHVKVFRRDIVAFAIVSSLLAAAAATLTHAALNAGSGSSAAREQMWSAPRVSPAPLRRADPAAGHRQEASRPYARYAYRATDHDVRAKPQASSQREQGMRRTVDNAMYWT